MASRRRSVATPVSWLVATGVALAVSAACDARDRPPVDPRQRAQPTAPAPDPAVVYCQVHIDALIAADIVPRSDRDYAMGMCETQQRS